MRKYNVRQYSSEAKQEITSLRKLSDANKRALKLLGDHAEPVEIAKAYQDMQKRMAPNLIEKLISARRKELKRERDE